MASSVHECTFSLEILDHGPYLTGWYRCTQCGAHKSAQGSMQVSDLLVWRQHLEKAITESEVHLQQLRNEIGGTSLEKKRIADSLADLEKSLAVLRRTHKQIEMSAEVLVQAHVHSVDLHGPSAHHVTSK